MRISGGTLGNNSIKGKEAAGVTKVRDMGEKGNTWLEQGP